SAKAPNIILRLVYAILGGMVGLLLWLFPIWLLDMIVYITVILIGVGVGSGIRGFNFVGEGTMINAIMAFIIATVLLIVGDITESWLLFGNIALTIDNITELAMFKIEDDFIRGMFYLMTPFVAAYTAKGKFEQPEQDVQA
ncbi:MAG: hypothetical protein AAFQ52_20680, partial [Chloroflexota bacterium]